MVVIVVRSHRKIEWKAQGLVVEELEMVAEDWGLVVADWGLVRWNHQDQPRFEKRQNRHDKQRK